CPAMILDIFTELDSTGNVFRQGDKNDMGLLLCHSALRKKYYPTSVFSDTVHGLISDCEPMIVD
ncbi:MAG: hypothetical protein ABIA21_01415, partial [Candidatus Aenigmatarchaeota archaeon]